MHFLASRFLRRALHQRLFRDGQAQHVVDLAVIQPAVPIDVYLAAAHHVRHHGGVVVFGEQVQVVVELALVLQVVGEAAQGIVVEGVQVVELHALLAFQLERIVFFQFALVRR